jgi:hypothetical protein
VAIVVLVSSLLNYFVFWHLILSNDRLLIPADTLKDDLGRYEYGKMVRLRWLQWPGGYSPVWQVATVALASYLFFKRIQ